MFAINKDKLPLVSVIIATYNSSAVLDRTLSALRRQDYPQDRLEVITVDGGSKDDTLEIAQKYNCIIKNNPKKDPVSAKMIGNNSSNGRYIVTLDHDEVLTNSHSIYNKVAAMMENPQCKVAFCTGYKRPLDYPGLNQYISEYGDPFSLFIYRFSKDWKYFTHNMAKKAALVTERDEYTVFSFRNNRPNVIIELCCLATMIDRDYFSQIADFLNKPEVMVHMFYKMLAHGENQVIVLKNDPIVHYSVDSLYAYLPKLRWRIINNVHYADRASQGYTGRSELGSKWSRIKKYLFPIYSFSIIIPLIDSIVMSVKRKNISYMWHWILSIYVSAYIIYQYILKILGKKPELKTYSGDKIKTNE